MITTGQECIQKYTNKNIFTQTFPFAGTLSIKPRPPESIHSPKPFFWANRFHNNHLLHFSLLRLGLSPFFSLFFSIWQTHEAPTSFTFLIPTHKKNLIISCSIQVDTFTSGLSFRYQLSLHILDGPSREASCFFHEELPPPPSSEISVLYLRPRVHSNLGVGEKLSPQVSKTMLSSASLL